MTTELAGTAAGASAGGEPGGTGPVVGVASAGGEPGGTGPVVGVASAGGEPGGTEPVVGVASAGGEPGGTEPVVGVLALQGDVAEHVRALRAAGASPLTVRRTEELDRVEGLIIPGGESTTIWKLIDVFGLADQLRKRIAGGMPVFGSCAGLIMLADRLPDPASGQQTLGGIDMTVRRNAFGRQVDSFERELNIVGLGGRPYRAVFIRAPWVEEVGPDVEVLATDPGTSKIVAVRQGRALATSFHPELTPDWRIHEMFVDMVRDGA